MNILEKLGCTPGPWEVKQNPCGYTSIGNIEAGYDYYFGAWVDCYDSDAQLIASAPELLEALINIGLYGALKNEGDWQKIQPIIEKATGRTWAEIKEMME